MRIHVTGFSHMKGNSQKNGKPYEMARLYRLTEINAWETEHGKSQCAGYETNERKVLEVDIKDPSLVKKLLELPYQADKGILIEMDLEPNPDDPMRNMIVGAELVNK